MLITVLLTIAFVVCIVSAKRTKKYDREMTFTGIGVLLAIILFFIYLVNLTTAFNENKDQMDQDYVILTQKIESDYWYGNPLLTTDLVNDVQEYNRLVKSMKDTYSSPWTSWFGRAWMMELNTIEIPGGSK